MIIKNKFFIFMRIIYLLGLILLFVIQLYNFYLLDDNIIKYCINIIYQILIITSFVTILKQKKIAIILIYLTQIINICIGFVFLSFGIITEYYVLALIGFVLIIISIFWGIYFFKSKDTIEFFCK